MNNSWGDWFVQEHVVFVFFKDIFKFVDLQVWRLSFDQAHLL